MPTLDWLNRAEALTAADRVPYRVLEAVSEHGDGDPENLLITLARMRFVLARSLVAQIEDLRRVAMQSRFRQLVLDGGWNVEPEWQRPFVFEPGRHAAHAGSRYQGRWEFKRHYYPVIADLKAHGEEFDCAVGIDRHPDVRHWVRNLDSEPFGFWLPTSRGRFYPDFIVERHAGIIAVIEYKGAHLRDDRYEIEKRQVGELWAERSAGKCHFAFVYLSDGGRDMQQQLDRVLAG